MSQRVWSLTRRLLASLITLWLLISLCFALMRVAPGGPFASERPVSAETATALNAHYGLDQPLWRQYTSYMAALLRGDFGPSYQYTDRSVNELLAQALPVSLLLGGLAALMALALGVPSGLWLACRAGPGRRRLAELGLLLIMSTPAFVLAPLLISALALRVDWLPAGGWQGGRPDHLLLPVTVLALVPAAIITRLVWASASEALDAPSVRTARSLGHSPSRVLMVDVLPRALRPIISYLPPTVAGLLTGSVVVEQIFGLPGLGRFFVFGALNRDYSLVMAVVIVYGALMLVLSQIAEGLQAAINGRSA